MAETAAPLGLAATAAQVDADWMRRAARGLWPHLHWLVLASVPVSGAGVLALALGRGSVLAALPLAAPALLPGLAVLGFVAHRVVVDGDFSPRHLRRPGWSGWARATAVVAVAYVLLALTLVAFEVYGRTGAWVALVPVLLGAAATTYATLLATIAVPLAFDRPTAPWRNLWVVGLLATARSPVPILGACVFAVIALGAAWRFQILLAVTPALVGVVFVAAAWTALGALGVRPDSTSLDPQTD